MSVVMEFGGKIFVYKGYRDVIKTCQWSWNLGPKFVYKGCREVIKTCQLVVMNLGF